MSMLTWYLDPCSDISMDLYLLCLLVTSKSMLIFIVIRLDTHFISISRMLKATLVKSNIRYRGAQIWNHLFDLGIDSEAPELVFANCMKFDIRNSMLTALQTIGLLHPSVSRYMYLYGLTCHKNDWSFFFYIFSLFTVSYVNVISFSLSPYNDINFRHRYFRICYSYSSIAPVLFFFHPITNWIRSSDNDSTGFWPPGSLHSLGADGHI